MLGVALALLSTLSFSINGIMSRRGLAVASASAGAFVTVLMGVPLFFVAAVVTGQLFNAGDVPGSGYLYLSLAGIIHFGAGRYCNYRAIAAIGVTRVGPIQTITIPYAILIAFLFLDEGINVTMGLAIGLILIGPAVQVERRRAPAKQEQAAPRGASDTAPAFELRQAEGYFYALLSVVAYGTSPILIRAALADVSNVSIYGGLIAYVAASAVLVATLVLPSRRGLIGAMRPSTVRLFLGAGIFVFLAQMFRFMALSLVPVAVVTPLQRSGGVFTLVLSWAINRHLEKITWRVVLGLAISMVGAVILVIARVD